MTVGAPPKTYSDEEVIQLGEDLVKWIENEGKDEMFFERWFYGVKKMFRSDWKALIQRKYFLPYYEIARRIMVNNMIKNESIPQSYGNRYASMYDDLLLHHEEGIKDREGKRKSAENKSLPPNDSAVSTLLALINDNKSLNERLEALKNATQPQADSVDPASDA